MPVATRTLLWSLLFALTAIGSVIWQAWPREVPEAGVERVDCVSYAPFRLPGESPFDETARVSRARIAEDLRLLSARTQCVRTYSIDQGLDQVPEVARELGMQVLMGVWLNRDRARNAVELQRALALTQAHRDVVRALVVGNEVMLRRELAEHELLALLQQARAGAGVPVTYADVWEFWHKHPRLAGAVDFITIHILPYWEDEPVGVDEAVTHVVDIYRQMQQAFPGRTLLIGETGWPRAGRARRQAEPGVVEQARFVRGFVAEAHAQRLPYNLIEGFDQPWKRHLEGAMGGYWGLFDSAGRPAFPWHGPIAPEARWREPLLAGGAAMLLAGALALFRQRREIGLSVPPGRRGVDGAALGAQLLCGLAVGIVLHVQWRYVQTWHRDALELAIGGGGAVLGALMVWLAVRRAGGCGEANGYVDPAGGAAPGRAAPGRAAQLPGLAELLRIPSASTSAAPSRPPTSEALLSALRALFLFGAAATLLLLVFDARYRGFPWPLFALPTGAMLLLAAQGQRLPPDAREERLLAGVMVAAAPLVALLERPSNLAALGFLALLLALAAACFGLPHQKPGRGAVRTSTSAPSSAASADGSNE